MFLNNQLIITKFITLNSINEISLLKKINRFRNMRLISKIQLFQFKVSFTHISNTIFFLRFFFAINRKYFIEIFRKTFKMNNLHKLFNDYSTKTTFDKIKTYLKSKNFFVFFKCFKIYCQIVFEFVFDLMFKFFLFFII